jgi:acetyl esterase/lipase
MASGQNSWNYTSVYLDKPLIKGRVLDIFEPENVSSEISIFFIHGGGWNAGSRDIFHPLMQEFNRLGLYCASADYRLTGTGATALDQLTDLRQAYDQFVSFLRSRQRPVKIIVHGSSAGAHLSALLALAAPGQCGESLDFNGYTMKNQWVEPVGAVLSCGPATLVPWEDIFPGIVSNICLAAGCSYEENPELYQRLSPEHYAAESPCPVFFSAAANEHIFPNEQVQALTEKIQAVQPLTRYKCYANCEHGFYYDITRSCQKAMQQDFVDFIADVEAAL